MKNYVICDMDGCLSDDRWRRRLLPSETARDQAAYDAYHELALHDQSVDEVRDELFSLLFGSDGEQKALLLVVTARPDRYDYRVQTENWLAAKLPGVKLVLLMRPNDSFLPSRVLKLNLIDEYFMTASSEYNAARIGWSHVIKAFDDRADVLESYPISPDICRCVSLGEAPEPVGPAAESVPGILAQMAETFMERNKEYSDNWRMVAPIMRALWPAGVPSDLVVTDHWHLFELLIVKLTRFASSSLKHIDSIHDAAVYAAMIESVLARRA